MSAIELNGKILRDLLSGPLADCPIRWGLTGTLPEEEYEKVAITCCIGPVLNKIDTQELQDKGLLAKLDIHVWQLKDVGESFTNYQSELKWLTTNQSRLKFIAKKVDEISQTGNTVVLVDRIETGELFQKLIPGSIFISGKVKSKDRKAEYNEMQEVDGKVIIATFGVLSTRYKYCQDI